MLPGTTVWLAAWLEANSPLVTFVSIGAAIASLVVAILAWKIARDSSRSNFYTATQDLLRCRLNIRDTRRAIGGETWTGLLACRRAGELHRVAREDQRGQFLVDVAFLAGFVLDRARKGDGVQNEQLVHLKMCCQEVQDFDEIDEDYTGAEHEEKIETHFEEYLSLDMTGMTFSEFLTCFEEAIQESRNRYEDRSAEWGREPVALDEFGDCWRAVLRAD